MFEISSVKELALGANTDAPVDRIKWSTDGESALSLSLSLFLSQILSHFLASSLDRRSSLLHTPHNHPHWILQFQPGFADRRLAVSLSWVQNSVLPSTLWKSGHLKSTSTFSE